MMFYVMTFGWIFTTILFFSGPGIREIPQLTLNGWLGVSFLGIFCSGLAYIAWYDALQALPAAQLGAFLYLEPPVAVIVAALILTRIDDLGRAARRRDHPVWGLVGEPEPQIPKGRLTPAGSRPERGMM